MDDIFVSALEELNNEKETIKFIEMKEYTLIYFNEDGGCNISFLSSSEMMSFLDDLIQDYDTELLTLFFNDSNKNYDSMYVGESKYMIIKGLPVLPEIVTTVTKLKLP